MYDFGHDLIWRYAWRQMPGVSKDLRAMIGGDLIYSLAWHVWMDLDSTFVIVLISFVSLWNYEYDVV